MTTRNIQSIGNHTDSHARSNNNPLADEEREGIREHYRSLNFKEFLAACPIEGLELARELTYPREMEL